MHAPLTRDLLASCSNEVRRCADDLAGLQAAIGSDRVIAIDQVQMIDELTQALAAVSIAIDRVSRCNGALTPTEMLDDIRPMNIRNRLMGQAEEPQSDRDIELF